MRTATDGVRALRRLRALAVVTAGLWAASTRGQVMDSEPYWSALVDQLEVAPARDGTPVKVDATGWYGGDVNRVCGPKQTWPPNRAAATRRSRRSSEG